MVILIISCLFWLAGMGVMISADYLQAKKGHAEKDLHEHADKTADINTSESIYMRILEKVISYIPWFVIRIMTTIVGLFMIAIGFIFLAFYRV